MPPRSLLLCLLFISPAAHAADAKASKPAAAKAAKPSKKTRSWKDLIDYVKKNGSEQELSGAIPEHVGFTGPIKTVGMRITKEKSADGMQHSIYVTRESDKPSVIIARTKRLPDNNVQGLVTRLDENGKALNAFRSEGPAKNTKHTVLSDLESAEFKMDFSSESDYFLKKIDFEQLTSK